MVRLKKPDAYKMVARSRQDIVNAILNMTTKHDGQCLCFNVKIHNCDLSLENLLKLFKEQEGDHAGMYNEDWLTKIKDKYEEVKEELFYWAIEDAQRSFVSDRKDGQLDDDTFTHLYNGTKLNVEYGFYGRSAGWLAIVRFEGYDFEYRKMNYDLEYTLQQMDFVALKKLYQLVLMLKHDLRDEVRTNVIETNAAFNFFANICGRIKQPETSQTELFRTKEEIVQEALA